MRRAVFAFVAFLGLTAPAGAATAPNALVLRDGTPAYRLIDAAGVLPDPRGDLGVGQVASRGDFRSPRDVDFNASSLQPKTYWLRFSLDRAHSYETWALIIRADVGRVDWFAQLPGGGFAHVLGGLDVPRGGDALEHRILVVPVAAYGATNYLRVVNAAGPETLELIPLAAGMRNVVQRNTLHVFFMGYYVAIAGLYLLLFAILRQRPLVQYAGIMVSLTALLYVDSGSAFDVLPAMTLAQRLVLHDLLIFLYFMLLVLFTTTFLRLLQRDRIGFAAIVVTAIVNGLGLVTDFVGVPDWVMRLVDPATYLFFLSLFVAGLRAWRSGMRPAMFYSFAIATVLIGYAFNGVVSGVPSWFNALPVFVEYGFETAVALEALLLGIAVTERIRETAREYERLLVASRELEDIALHDSLTGVLNRRAFDRGLADAWHTGAARRETLGLLMIDIDYFKRFNDRFGHQAGDACLERIARACAHCVRGGDLFARYGGEEFSAIVPNATLGELEHIARRMRAAVADLRIEHDTPSGYMTLSIGGAAKHASDVRSEQGLVALADAALYRAKEAGRDCVVFDGDVKPIPALTTSAQA